MKKTDNFRKRVMMHARAIWMATGKTWSLCLKMAWNVYRLVKAMKEGTIAFAYRKIDGTVRNAYGTLVHIPADFISGKKRTKPSYKSLTYFDVEKNAFRCFRIENLISRF